MRLSFTFILILFYNLYALGQQLSPQHWFDSEVVVQSEYFLFGDKVNLRSEPSTDAEIVQTLPFYTKVKAIETTSELIRVSSHNSFWTQVELENGSKGYLPSTFIATGQLTLPSGEQLLYKRKNINGELLIFFRLSNGNNQFNEMGTFSLLNRNFQITLLDDKGLSSINHIIKIDYLSEACGDQGGTTYLTLNLKSKDLLYLAAMNKVADGDMFFVNENLIFPNDPNGIENTIIYEGEEGQMIDEETSFFKTVSFSKNYEWYGSGTKYPIKSFDYDDSSREEMVPSKK